VGVCVQRNGILTEVFSVSVDYVDKSLQVKGKGNLGKPLLQNSYPEPTLHLDKKFQKLYVIRKM